MKNLGNGVMVARYNVLVGVIGNLDGYRYGRSTLQEYYFPIRSLSEAVYSAELNNCIEQEDALTL